MKFINHRFIRFLVVGGLNTLLSYALYLLILQFADYTLAYTLSYVSGIFIAYAFNSFFVFRTPFSWQKGIQYPLVYLGQYLLGLGILWIEVTWLNLDERVMPLVNVIILIPITYIFNKWLLMRRSPYA